MQFGLKLSIFFVKTRQNNLHVSYWNYEGRPVSIQNKIIWRKHFLFLLHPSGYIHQDPPGHRHYPHVSETNSGFCLILYWNCITRLKWPWTGFFDILFITKTRIIPSLDHYSNSNYSRTLTTPQYSVSYCSVSIAPARVQSLSFCTLCGVQSRQTDSSFSVPKKGSSNFAIAAPPWILEWCPPDKDRGVKYP